MCSFRISEETRNGSQERRSGEEKERKGKVEREEMETQRKQMKKRKTSLDEKEDKFMAKEREISVSLTTAQQLLGEGNERLKEAIKNGNLQHAATAHLMIETGTAKTKECTKALEKLREKQRKLVDKKRKLLDQNLSLLESSKKLKTGE